MSPMESSPSLSNDLPASSKAVEPGALRIVLMGRAAFGAAVLEALLAKGETVVAVFGPPSRQQSKSDALQQSAMQHGTPVYQTSTYKDDGIFRIYTDLKPDLTILAYVTEIIPPRYFDASTHGAICFHPSLLPRHRGASAINWALMMGDEKTGVTVFSPDAGIDTGRLLFQREVEIRPEDSVGSLYFERLSPMGVEAIVECVEMIRTGQIRSWVQNEAEATYEPPCDDRVAAIDWSRPAREIYNLIRGCDPSPGAYFNWKGRKIRLYDASILPPAGGVMPGQIEAIDPPAIRISVLGGRIQVGKIRAEGAGKVDASDFALQQGMAVLDRLPPNG